MLHPLRRALYALAVTWVVTYGPLAHAFPSAPDAEVAGLSPDMQARYANEHVTLERAGKNGGDFRLIRGGVQITNATFRSLYRDATHANDLDTHVGSYKKRQNIRSLVGAIGLTVLGGGGLAALAALPPSASGCTKTGPGCGKAVVEAGLLTTGGIYLLVCQTVKAASCPEDKNLVAGPWGLSPESAAPYVERYDAALVESLRSAPSQDASAPSALLDPDPPRTHRKAAIHLTPTGLGGTF